MTDIFKELEKICVTSDRYKICQKAWQEKYPVPLQISAKTIQCGIHDKYCNAMLFNWKMASALKCPQTAPLSAERVLELLEEDNDSDDGMSRSEESDLDRQLQIPSDELR